MGRNKERKSLAIKQGYKFTKNQLDKWGMKYDELLFENPLSIFTLMTKI